jgi:hypothetical protein
MDPDLARRVIVAAKEGALSIDHNAWGITKGAITEVAIMLKVPA